MRPLRRALELYYARDRAAARPGAGQHLSRAGTRELCTSPRAPALGVALLPATLSAPLLLPGAGLSFSHGRSSAGFLVLINEVKSVIQNLKEGRKKLPYLGS